MHFISHVENTLDDQHKNSGGYAPSISDCQIRPWLKNWVSVKDSLSFDRWTNNFGCKKKKRVVTYLTWQVDMILSLHGKIPASHSEPSLFHYYIDEGNVLEGRV